MPERSSRAALLGWFAAFLVLPLAVWFLAAHRNGFLGKNISNLSLEPMVVAVASCAVFVVWVLAATEGLKLLPGFILLVLLSAGAVAVQILVPGLRE